MGFRDNHTREYGGLGAGYVSYGVVAREIERIDSGYRSMMSVQSSLVMYPFTHMEQRNSEKVFAKLAAGELIVVLAY